LKHINEMNINNEKCTICKGSKIREYDCETCKVGNDPLREITSNVSFCIDCRGTKTRIDVCNHCLGSGKEPTK